MRRRPIFSYHFLRARCSVAGPGTRQPGQKGLSGIVAFESGAVAPDLLVCVVS